MERVNPALARILGLTQTTGEQDAQTDQAPPASPMRMMRRAVGRAADTAVSLSASVLGISEEDAEAEQVIESAPEDWLVLGLRDGRSAGLIGLFLLDLKMRSALIEMQTMGILMPAPETQRPATRTDAVMSVPFIQSLLEELEDTGFGTAQVPLGPMDITPMSDLRTAGLVMVQGAYRMWKVSLQMGGSDAQGEFMLALRHQAAGHDDPTEDTLPWSTALRAAVEQAPADLEAVLASMKLTIGKVDALQVGQVLPLPGTHVGSVQLIGPGGAVNVPARLGQIAGRRAVRLETQTVQLDGSHTGIELGASPQQAVETLGLDPAPHGATDGALTEPDVGGEATPAVAEPDGMSDAAAPGAVDHVPT